MFIKTSLLLILIFCFTAYPNNPGDEKFSYVGVKNCGMCHKKDDTGKQLAIWESSKHSQAYKSLLTADADKIAAEKGFTTKASETAECLKCHTSAYNVDAKLVTDKFSIADGVQCETCHGPGSMYKTKKVMEDRKAAIENGLIVFEKTEDLCLKCHNEESPFYKGFNFEEMWGKIKHSNPKKSVKI
jgi:hypothetical protein